MPRRDQVQLQLAVVVPRPPELGPVWPDATRRTGGDIGLLKDGGTHVEIRRRFAALPPARLYLSLVFWIVRTPD
jgi:hypothetical protein